MTVRPAVVWTRRARVDFDEHLLTISVFDPAAAARTEIAVSEKAGVLADYPHIGSPLDRGLRKSIVAGTRLLIVYRTRAMGVDIVRVFHERQDWR